MTRGVNSGRGVNSARGVNKSRGVNKARGVSGRGGYVEYLKSMKGRNKGVPLTPEQWKKQHGRL